MNSKQELMSLMAVDALALLAVTAATASSERSSHTSLYTVRMEQASSDMNFLPTAKNNIAFITGSGYGLNCDVAGYCSAKPLDTGGAFTCEVSCDPCLDTECSTCWATCVSTCDTCAYTCPYTCAATC